MKSKEIWIVAYIYSIICFIIYFGIEECKDTEAIELAKNMKWELEK